jgi:NAD(P)H-dependent FMN reductase
MTPYKVGYFVGSLAKASINRKLAHALVRLAPEGLEFAEISFKDLSLYSHDYDVNYPPVAQAFKQAIADVDAVLFVTPEYNRSLIASCTAAPNLSASGSMLPSASAVSSGDRRVNAPGRFDSQ